MINPFKIGDTKTHTHLVKETDTAKFASGEVHPVYATFALGREAEWACRLFVLEMKEADEEGIGTLLEVRHESPALLGQEVVFTATMIEVQGNRILCSYEAKVGERLIAKGLQEQRILKKEKIDRLFNSLKHG